MEQIVIIPNVLTKDQCELLISDCNFESSNNELGHFYSEDYNNLQRRKQQDHALVKELSNRFNLNITNAPVLWYAAGTSNTLHCDNSVIDGDIITKMTDWKKSAIIFLNDGFEGGQLIYPAQGVTIAPTMGTMVIAPAGPEFMHYVTTVNSDRYVLVLRII